MSAHSLTGAVLAFENTEFDVVDIHGVPWLRLPQIGAALDYASPYKLQQLYERNADEFTDEMTQVVELPTAGGVQMVRIFSPRGCYLIGMLARTERAKAFRAWVLDVLEGRVVPRETKPMTIPQTIAMHKLRLSLRRSLFLRLASGQSLKHGEKGHIQAAGVGDVPLHSVPQELARGARAGGGLARG